MNCGTGSAAREIIPVLESIAIAREVEAERGFERRHGLDHAGDGNQIVPVPFRAITRMPRAGRLPLTGNTSARSAAVLLTLPGVLAGAGQSLVVAETPDTHSLAGIDVELDSGAPVITCKAICVNVRRGGASRKSPRGCRFGYRREQHRAASSLHPSHRRRSSILRRRAERCRAA